MAHRSSTELDAHTETRPTQMNTKILIVIGVFLVLIGVIGIGIHQNLQKFGNKPIHSFKAAHEALTRRDLETFKKYVDTDKIIEVAAEEILTEHINDNISPTAYSMDAIRNTYENQLKPDFIKSARATLDEYISTGKVNFPDNPTAAQKFFSKSGITSCEIKDFTKPHLVGNVMTSSVIFYNSQMKFSFELVLEFEPAEEISWRIVNARGFESYYNGWRRALKIKLNSLNLPISRRMDEIFKVKSFTVKGEEGDEYGFSKTLDITLKAEVYPDKPLDKVIGNVVITDKDGKENFTPFALDVFDVAQGVQTFEVTKTLNPFIRADSDAMKHGLRKKDIRIEVNEIIFTDGTNLKLLDRLPE